MVVFGLDERAPDVDVVLEATPEYFVAPPLPLLALFCALDVALESSLRVGLSLFDFELFGDDVKNTLRSLLTSLHGAATRAGRRQPQRQQLDGVTSASGGSVQ